MRRAMWLLPLRTRALEKYTVRVRIHKHDHQNVRRLSYPGTMVQRDAQSLVAHATWTFGEKRLPYTTLTDGDLFVETFYFDRPYNVFEIRAHDGALKGWYANITRPARLENNAEDVIWEDLIVDAWMSADGHALTLDEDELLALGDAISAPDRALIASALPAAHADLRLRWRSHAVRRIGAAMQSRGWRLASAESCTGGGIGDAITNEPGVSSWYLGGIVAYDNAVKMAALRVPEETLRTHGAVSAQTARAMALGARGALGAAVGVSSTGVAGPDGGSAEKPAGLVFVGISTPDGERIVRCQWSHDRVGNKQASIDAALRLLIEEVAGG
jgi:PncC family amidohydrolase